MSEAERYRQYMLGEIEAGRRRIDELCDELLATTRVDRKDPKDEKPNETA